MTLTDHERDLIAEARRIGPELRTGAQLKPEQVQLAGWLLKDLADLAERLAGGQ